MNLQAVVRTRFAICLAVIATTGLCAGAFAQSAQAPVAARIALPVNDQERVTLRGNVHPLAVARLDRGEVAVSEPTGRIMLVLRRSAAQQQSLKEYLASLQSAASPNYHKWLTPTQFGKLYGPADADLQTIETWLQSYGFRIDKVPQARNFIQFSGNMGQVQSAFHVSMHTFVVNGKQYYANVNDPQIPAALAPVVAGIARLNSFHPQSHAVSAGTGRYDAVTHTFQPQLTLFGSGGQPYLFVDPADAATIYDTPNATLNANYSGTTYDGTGVSIGIAGDSDFTAQDVVNYREAFLNETAATANAPTVVIDGNDPGINGDETEALLDTEVSGGIAPNASIYFYTSANTDLQAGLFLAILRAIDDNTVSILSISFGECESDLGAAGNALVLEATQQAAAQGISVAVSAGDNGSAGCDDQDAETQAQYGLAVNGLAASPYVVAVGGTDFDVLSNNFTTYVQDQNGSGQLSSGSSPYYRTALSYIPEEPWNDSTQFNLNIASNQPLTEEGSTNIIAGGGGASSVYAKPSFQAALTPADSSRDLPDVSFLAGNGLYDASWVVCADGNCQTANGALANGATVSGVGGTSAAAPAFAGMLALVEQKAESRLGQADYVLYQLASTQYSTVFHDETTGDNSVVCQSGTSGCGSNNFMTGYNAGADYDQTTGLGSVDAAQLVNNWGGVPLTSTTTSLNINGSTAAVNVAHGTKLTFNVAVTPSSVTGVAGLVDTANEVLGGPQNDGQLAIPLTGGVGSASYNGLPGGTYTVYARYGGDASDASSNSTPVINVTISPEASTTALKVNAYSAAPPNAPIGNLSAIPYGSFIAADASIYGAAEGASGTQGIATGTVNLIDGSTALASGIPVSSANVANYMLPNPNVAGSQTAFSVGNHNLTAAYSGDASYNPSTSAAVPFTIVKGSTQVSPSLSSTSINSESSTTITVNVFTGSLGAFPTGSITLTANGSTLATITGLTDAYSLSTGTVVAAGLATINGSQLVGGSNTITATYSGDPNYLGSTGTINVSVAASSFSLANSGALAVTAGASTGNTSTITVAPVNGFLGAVNLSCAVTTAPSAAQSPVTCSIPTSAVVANGSSVTVPLTVSTTSSTTAGTYAVTVSGTDAATGKISTSTVVNVAVTAPAGPAGFTLANSGNITVAPGATTGNTTTISVTPVNGFTGGVALSCAVSGGSSSTASPSCNIPSSVSISGSSSATATLTITTTAASNAGMSLPMLFGQAGSVALAVLFFFGIPARRRAWRTLMALLVAVLAISAIGCGGGRGSSPGGGGSGSGGTTAGTYSVTVSAVDTATNKITATTVVSVTVQ
jgi:trimeric autotransporter adhesin